MYSSIKNSVNHKYPQFNLPNVTHESPALPTDIDGLQQTINNLKVAINTKVHRLCITIDQEMAKTILNLLKKFKILLESKQQDENIKKSSSLNKLNANNSRKIATHIIYSKQNQFNPKNSPIKASSIHCGLNLPSKGTSLKKKPNKKTYILATTNKLNTHHKPKSLLFTSFDSLSTPQVHTLEVENDNEKLSKQLQASQVQIKTLLDRNFQYQKQIQQLKAKPQPNINIYHGYSLNFSPDSQCQEQKSHNLIKEKQKSLQFAIVGLTQEVERLQHALLRKQEIS